MGSCIPSFVRAEVEFLERSVRLQRRAFNFRRGVTNASTSRRIIAAMLRHDESVDNVGTKTKASNEREQRRFVGFFLGGGHAHEALRAHVERRRDSSHTLNTAPKTTQHNRKAVKIIDDPVRGPRPLSLFWGYYGFEYHRVQDSA